MFSAHWETHGHIEGIPLPLNTLGRQGLTVLVMSYETNHLLYDYYNFPEEMYRVKFESRGSSAVASRIVELLTQVCVFRVRG